MASNASGRGPVTGRMVGLPDSGGRPIVGKPHVEYQKVGGPSIVRDVAGGLRIARLWLGVGLRRCRHQPGPAATGAGPIPLRPGPPTAEGGLPGATPAGR